MKKIIIYRHQIKRAIRDVHYNVVQLELNNGKIYDINRVIVASAQNAKLLDYKEVIHPKYIQKDTVPTKKANYSILRNDLLIPLTYDQN